MSLKLNALKYLKMENLLHFAGSEASEFLFHFHLRFWKFLWNLFKLSPFCEMFLVKLAKRSINHQQLENHFIIQEWETSMHGMMRYPKTQRSIITYGTGSSLIYYKNINETSSESINSHNESVKIFMLM